MPRSRFVVELSERAFGEGLRNGTVNHLVSSGVQLAVADFGAGWLSPADLRRVPVAYVRVPVRGMTAEDPDDLDALVVKLRGVDEDSFQDLAWVLKVERS